MASQRQAAGCPNVSDVKGGMNLGATRGLPTVNPSGYPANGGWRPAWISAAKLNTVFDKNFLQI